MRKNYMPLAAGPAWIFWIGKVETTSFDRCVMRRLMFFLFFVPGVLFQTFAQEFTDSLRFIELNWSMKKKALILDYMDLSEADKSSFWPVYEYYTSATKHLELECVYLISRYSREFDQLSPKEMIDMQRRILENDVTLAKLRRVFFRRFKKALSARQAAVFMQIDNTFRSTIRMNAQMGWPPTEFVQGVFISQTDRNLAAH